MKYKATLITLLAAAAVFAQTNEEEKVAPAGTPASLLASNGKKAPRVYLQKIENSNLTFEIGSKSMTVPADKVTSLGFSMGKDEFDFYRVNNIISNDKITEISAKEEASKAEKLQLIFEAILKNITAIYESGDYTAAIAALDPLMKDRGAYMAIENNLVEYYLMFMESHRALGNNSTTKQCASILLQSADANVVNQAKANLAIIAVEEGDYAKAETLSAELSSEAAKMYIQAISLRAQDKPKEAMQLVTTIILDHGNDMEWMSSTELLSANLYVDMIGTNSIITTNSAVQTARQTKNIYKGSAVAADARKLWVDLGGEEIQKQIEAEIAQRKKDLAEAKARREEAKKAREAEKKAKEAAEAAAAAASGTNLTASAESTNSVETAETVETVESE